MGLKIYTPPSSEPITLAELKAQAAIDTADTSLDGLCAIAIAAARAKAENYTGRSLVTQTWDQTLDAFPSAEIELLRPPVASISSVSYVDEAGATQTLNNTLYTLDTTTFPGWLLPAVDTEWPATREQANAVTIRYVCGYGEASSVPADIRAWLLMTAAFLVNNREAFDATGKLIDIPSRFVDSLLDPYRVFKV